MSNRPEPKPGDLVRVWRRNTKVPVTFVWARYNVTHYDTYGWDLEILESAWFREKSMLFSAAKGDPQ